MPAPTTGDGAPTLAARYHALTQVSLPARYPLVQFPNTPLWVALAASLVGLFVSGEAQDYVTAIGTIGIAVWAWEELFRGVNLFRHVLGAVVLVNTVIGLAARFT